MTAALCRLCRTPLPVAPALSMAPFPQAAQYYPEPDAFNEDRGITLNVHACPACALVQLVGRPVDYYRDVITAASLSADARAARLAEFSRLVERFGLKGRAAVEVGCGTGGMVEVLRAAGLDAVGLEHGAASVAEAQAAGRPVVEGYLDDLPAEHEGRYAAFVSLNYIEHQPDTHAFIEGLRRITTPDAIGYVTAPNVDYLLKHRVLYEFVADHLVYFTEATLRRAFETHGFDVLDSRLINNDNDVAVTVRRRPVQAIVGQEEVAALVGDLRVLVARLCSEGKRVAVWGAGHRTLALLAMAELTSIDAIVDSAPFKQGCYSPVTHRLIISPEALEASEIDVVLIMVPGLYPAEVERRLRAMRRPFEIYKLQDNQLIAA